MYNFHVSEILTKFIFEQYLIFIYQKKKTYLRTFLISEILTKLISFLFFNHNIQVVILQPMYLTIAKWQSGSCDKKQLKNILT